MEELAMTTATSTSATSRQERKPTDRELTADELERISGGRGSDGKPVEFITFTIKNVTTTSIGW
jgi:hypothetical protein